MEVPLRQLRNFKRADRFTCPTWRIAPVRSRTVTTKRSAFILIKRQCCEFHLDLVEEAVELREAELWAARRRADQVDAERRLIRMLCKDDYIRRQNRDSRRELHVNANFILIPMCACILPHQFRRNRCGRE